MWWSLEFDSLGIFCFEWYYGSDDSMFVHFILQCKLSSFVHKPWGASSYYLEQSSWSYHNIYLSFGIFFVVHLVACFICWSFLTLLSFCNLWSYLWCDSFRIFVIGYVHLIPLKLWEMHTLWRNSHYIGLLNFSPISAIGANGGEVWRV